jgi:hypothetical protein
MQRYVSYSFADRYKPGPLRSLGAKYDRTSDQRKVPPRGGLPAADANLEGQSSGVLLGLLGSVCIL